jgi:hypothetical protein
MRAALEDFDSRMSMQICASAHGIPYSTFREWCYGMRKTMKRGPASVLSLEENNQIMEYLVNICERGLGLIPIALKLKVYEVTKGIPHLRMGYQEMDGCGALGTAIQSLP